MSDIENLNPDRAGTRVHYRFAVHQIPSPASSSMPDDRVPAERAVRHCQFKLLTASRCRSGSPIPLLQRNFEMEKSSTYANPAPLGLLGFGMTTVLLNLLNAGAIRELSILIIAMGIALGGTAQIIAGLMEFKKGNTFGTTAFTAYGLFWWSTVLIWLNPFAKVAAADATSLAYYMLLWGIFTAFMFIGTLKHSKTSQLIFFTLTILFLMLSLSFFTGVAAIEKFAGYVGIICGLSAIYNALAQIVNNEFGKNILPL